MSDKAYVFPSATAVKLAELVDFQDGAIVSKTLRRAPNGNLTVFAFDKGQELSEHSAPFDAYVQVLDGEALLIIGGEKVSTKAGEIVLMPADVPHAVQAPERFKMQLLMFKG